MPMGVGKMRPMRLWSLYFKVIVRDYNALDTRVHRNSDVYSEILQLSSLLHWILKNLPLKRRVTQPLVSTIGTWDYFQHSFQISLGAFMVLCIDMCLTTIGSTTTLTSLW